MMFVISDARAVRPYLLMEWAGGAKVGHSFIHVAEYSLAIPNITLYLCPKICMQSAMAQLKNEAAYRVALQRIDELLPLVNDSTPMDDKNYIELDMISDLVEEYEAEHYPIATPSLTDTLKLRMYEMGLNQVKLAELLGISPARISEIIAGRGEPSLKTGREICRKLNIDPAIVLGV